MKVAVTGASGLIGHHVACHLSAVGHEVLTLGRRPAPAGGVWQRWELGEAPGLRGVDALVHAAFSHVPGRYRGGEGDDPGGFTRRNLDGTLVLFDAALKARVGCVLFLSSRAVYGDYPPGTSLSEGLPLRPDTLYGRLKRDTEAALSASGLCGASLRPTGVYGPAPPGRRHKWHDLFEGFRQGQIPKPRVGTELHVDDLAAAVALLLSLPALLDGGAYNLSDIILDRRDLLTEYAALTGTETPLPARADPARLRPMSIDRMRALGWRPRGMVGLRPALRTMAAVD